MHALTGSLLQMIFRGRANSSRNMSVSRPLRSRGKCRCCTPAWNVRNGRRPESRLRISAVIASTAPVGESPFACACTT